MGWETGILVFILGASAGVWTLREGAKRRRVRFANREVLSMDAIYERFFGSKGLPKEAVVELWNEVARPLGIDPGRLRPTDRFDMELSPVEEWDDDIVEVHWAAERRLKKMGLKVDSTEVRTLGDYIEFFCRLQAPIQGT